MKPFNKEISTVPNTDIANIKKWELFNNVRIPSDYTSLLLNYNGLKINDGFRYEIINADRQRIVEFDEVFQLQYLEGELPLIREIEAEDGIDILNRFCPIVRTASKIILLIGNADENMNEIFLWNYEFYDDNDSPERLHKVAEDIFDLINNRLERSNG